MNIPNKVQHILSEQKWTIISGLWVGRDKITNEPGYFFKVISALHIEYVVFISRAPTTMYQYTLPYYTDSKLNMMFILDAHIEFDCNIFYSYLNEAYAKDMKNNIRNRNR